MENTNRSEDERRELRRKRRMRSQMIAYIIAFVKYTLHKLLKSRKTTASLQSEYGLAVWKRAKNVI